MNERTSDTDLLWEFLRERAGVNDDTVDRDVSRAARRDALVSLLDATAGVLAASRQLLMVVEDIVAHQRDRLTNSEADGWARSPDNRADRDEPTRIDLSY